MTILIIWLLAFVVAITVHEASHALAADRLGDPTPRLMGRLSLNPLVHYDPVGTTLLFGLVILRAFGFPVIPFGWAKPVMFDPYNLANPRRDSAIISFAGPLSNIALATFLAIVLRIASIPFSPVHFLIGILEPFILLNVVLGLFNLVPIHPLDGGKILVGLLPKKEAYQLDRFMGQYGLIILFILIFPLFGGQPLLFTILGPILNIVLALLIPGSPIV
jgi:Zn-dependent protease